MYGQVISCILILFSLYILVSFLFQNPNEAKKASQIYHIGCFDTTNTISQSTEMIIFIQNVERQVSNFSHTAIQQINQQIAYRSDDFNYHIKEAAFEFQQYLNSQYKIRSRGHYEQNYQKNLKQALQSFKNCHHRFSQQSWNCSQVYKSYLDIKSQFDRIKHLSQDRINKKAAHLQKMQEYTQSQRQDNNQNDNFTKQYHKKIEILNKQLNKVEEQLRLKNITYHDLKAELFQKEHNLNDTKNILKQCQMNKKQIDYCQNISDNIKQIHTGTTKDEIHQKMSKKRQVLEHQQTALAKTKKLNQSTVILESQISLNKQELAILEQIYIQIQGLGLCGQQIFSKCSNLLMKQLEKNVTTFANQIYEIGSEQMIIQIDLNNLGKSKDQLLKKKQQADKQLDIKIGSSSSFQASQYLQLETIKLYRLALNEMNKGIIDLSLDLQQIKKQRQEKEAELGKIRQKAMEVDSCIDKKDYYFEMRTKRPKTKEEDARLGIQASDALIKKIRAII